MTYALQEQYTSNNFTPADQVPAVFGMPREVKYITIHHWGVNGQQFDVVRNFLCTNTTPTSAHFVVQAGLVACIVNPDDAAWHAGNPQGNAQSIGIECHPEATDGDYQTIGELVAYLRGIYGDVPLVPHNYWTSTACPGDYDLGRIDAIARGTSVQAATVTPIQEDTLSAAEVADIKSYIKALAYSGWQDDNGNKHPGFMWTIEETQKRVDAIPAKVWGTTVSRGAGKVSALQELADAKTAALQGLHAAPVSAPSIDVKALAAEIAANLTTNQAHQFIVALGQALPKE